MAVKKKAKRTPTKKTAASKKRRGSVRRRRKQNEVTAETFVLLAKGARERAQILTHGAAPPTTEDEHAARSLREFAALHQAEADRLRKKR